MRVMAWCVLTLTLVGCQSGPRWTLRDRMTSGTARATDYSAYEEAPEAAPEKPQVPPLPADAERSNPQSSTRPRASTNTASKATASKAGDSKRSGSKATASKQVARTNGSSSARSAAIQDDATKQLMSDLEKIKRDKALLEGKLSEQSAKQTQQRLELEARLAVLQEQLRQVSTLQQVNYQQAAQTAARPTQNYGSVPNSGYVPGYHGPVINSGAPSPSVPQAWSNNGNSNNGNIPAWNPPTPAWGSSNQNAAPVASPVEMWPHSPQRR